MRLAQRTFACVLLGALFLLADCLDTALLTGNTTNAKELAVVLAEFKRVINAPGFQKRRGVVIPAGGKHLLSNAYVTARVLREHHRSNIPILIVYCGAEEYVPEVADLLKSLGRLSLRDTCEEGMFPEHHFRPAEKPGWVKKVIGLYFAIDFDEILLLDADCMPLHDPELLFADPAYVEHGSLFWPDYQAAHGEVAPSEEAYEMFGLKAPWHGNEKWLTTESGQFLLDRRRHADVLEMVLMLNLHYELTYKTMFGDKDSFEIGFALVDKLADFQKVFSWPRSALSNLNSAKRWHNRGHIQNDRQGAPLFLHRTDAKLEHSGKNAIAFVTSQIGPETYARDFFYDKENRALNESSAREDLTCEDMDEHTVAVLQHVDRHWNEGCKGAPMATDAPVFVIPTPLFGPPLLDVIRATSVAMHALHQALNKHTAPSRLLLRRLRKLLEPVQSSVLRQ